MGAKSRIMVVPARGVNPVITRSPSASVAAEHSYLDACVRASSDLDAERLGER